MKKRRGNNEGSIYQSNTTGNWVAQYIVNGKRKSLYGKSKKEVQEKLSKVLLEIANGKYIEKNKTTLIDLINERVKNKYETNLIGTNTYRTNLQTIKRIENHYIAKLPIQSIKEEDIKDFAKTQINFSNSVIKKDFELIKQAFRSAEKKNIINANILDSYLEDFGLPKSKVKAKKVEAFTVEEQQKLISALKKYNTGIEDIKIKNIILLAMYSGMRIGEILALKINDIDLNNNLIKVRRTITRDENDKFVIGDTTKTVRSNRNISISQDVRKILIESKRYYTLNSNDLLFCRNNGNIFSEQQINSRLKRLCLKNKIRLKEINNRMVSDVHTHMLRHTFATRCIESLMPAKILQQKLGHTKITVTYDVYGDIFRKFEDAEDEKHYEYLKENNIAL